MNKTNSDMNMKGGLNRMKNILMVSLLTLVVVSVFAFAGVFAIATDTTSAPLAGLSVSNSDLNPAEMASISVIGPVGALLGYAEKTDGSDARHIRMWIGRVRIASVNSSVLDQATAIRGSV